MFYLLVLKLKQPYQAYKMLQIDQQYLWDMLVNKMPATNWLKENTMAFKTEQKAQLS